MINKIKKSVLLLCLSVGLSFSASAQFDGIYFIGSTGFSKPLQLNERAQPLDFSMSYNAELGILYDYALQFGVEVGAKFLNAGSYGPDADPFLFNSISNFSLLATGRYYFFDSDVIRPFIGLGIGAARFSYAKNVSSGTSPVNLTSNEFNAKIQAGVFIYDYGISYSLHTSGKIESVSINYHQLSLSYRYDF